jgi:hypothetical protein
VGDIFTDKRPFDAELESWKALYEDHGTVVEPGVEEGYGSRTHYYEFWRYLKREPWLMLRVVYRDWRGFFWCLVHGQKVRRAWMSLTASTVRGLADTRDGECHLM